MRRYSEQSTLLGRSVERPIKSFVTCFVRMEMYISRTIPKRILQEIFVLNFFSKQLRQNWTGTSEQSSGRGVDIAGWKRGGLLDPFSPLSAGSYKWSFTSESVVLVELVEVHFEIDG